MSSAKESQTTPNPEKSPVPPLLIDNRSALKGRNGLHALIVGISDYKHLPGGDGETAIETYNLNQLTSAATSAYKLYEWLKARGHHLGVPLATIRLLLSPSRDESDLAGLTGPANWDNFADAAHGWRDDASANDDDFTFFYFAGHGVIRNRSDSVLLFEDFAQPRRGPLQRTVELDNIFNGMAPPAEAERHRAKTQFYFIDACREFPEPLKDNERIGVGAIFESNLGGADRRVAPIFHAAVSGSAAYSIVGTQSLFSMALLSCLEGAGSEALPEDDSGEVKWHVSVHSLNAALPLRLKELNRQFRTDQDYQPVGIFKDATIHYLDGPPQVDVILRVVPPDAVPFIAVDVLDAKGIKVLWHLSPVNPHPYSRSLPAASYVVRATVLEPPKPPYVDYLSPAHPVEPRRPELRARAINDNS